MRKEKVINDVIAAVSLFIIIISSYKEAVNYGYQLELVKADTFNGYKNQEKMNSSLILVKYLEPGTSSLL